MKAAVTIPKPCHEDWNKMSAVEQGRHCQVCCKTVVDFSMRSNEEIAGYIRENSSQRICGNFRKDQVMPHVVEKPQGRYRLFMTGVYLFFTGLLFSSCGTRAHSNNNVVGKIAVDNSFTPQQGQAYTTKEDTLKKKPVCKKPEVTVEDSIEIYMRGEIAAPPNPEND